MIVESSGGIRVNLGAGHDDWIFGFNSDFSFDFRYFLSRCIIKFVVLAECSILLLVKISDYDLTGWLFLDFIVASISSHSLLLGIELGLDW